MTRTFGTRHRRVRSLCALGLAGASLCSSPAARAEGVRRLTAQQAIRLALSHNPDSQAAAQDVVAANGAEEQARVLPNPTVFVSALGTNIKPADAPIPNQFGVTWTLPIGGKRSAGIAAARAGTDAAQASLVATRRELALAVETAFVGVLLDQALLEFAEQDQQTFQESLQINELRYRDGKISYGEVLKLRIQAREVDDAVRESRQSLANDRSELARLVGEGVLAPDYEVKGSLEPPVLSPEPTTAALERQALARRPDYRALRAQQRSAEAALTLARRQPIPDLGVLADYNRVPGNAGNYDLQLTATVPLFDRNQGNITQARASYRKAGLALDALRAQVRADAERAVRAWKTSQERLHAYDRDFVKSAGESLDISRHSYEEGRGSLLDFLDAESSFRDVERAYRTAEADALLAAANLRFVSGEELP